MVYGLDDVDNIINEACPDLLKRFILDPWMIAVLKRAGVITESLDDELQAGGLSPQRRVNMFLENLKAGPVERFLNFCRIMDEEGRYHILKILNVKMDDIYAQLGITPRPATPERMDAAEAGHADYNDLPLWDQRHPDGGIFLYEDKDLERKIIVAAPILKRLVRTKDLWTYFQRYYLMDDLTVEQCQVGTRGDHVDNIIRYLKQSEVWRTHAFFRSLAQIDQAGLIDQVLGRRRKEYYMVNLKER